MDTRTGVIGEHERMAKYVPVQFLKPVDAKHLSPEIQEKLAKTGRAQVGRNSPCPCGSQKRFKRCCMVHEHEKKLPKFKKGDTHGKPWRKAGR